jgi:hypothetical protein
MGFVPHTPVKLALEMFCFIGLAATDYICFNRNQFPKWFLQLRFWLTGIVSLCFGANIYLFYTK